MRKGKRSIMSRHERLLGLLKAKLANVKTVGRVRISAKAELSVWEGGSIQIGDGSVIHRGAILSTYPGGAYPHRQGLFGQPILCSLRPRWACHR